LFFLNAVVSNYYFKIVHLKSIINSSALLFEVFLQSQSPNHISAGALVFSQLLLIGAPLEVQPGTMLASAVSLLTELSGVNVKCPFNYGALDGLLMLLNQMLDQVSYHFFFLFFQLFYFENV
jgi:fused-like protein